ncbi:putative GPI-anchored protein PB15E9.01c [Scophthalmus maximus]|uniref:Putative GPI-anchored protein PB15E9.01c n=1 Tax=Scophthalmus maximus TaxID=52904 RepID=A0A2U9BLA0_SCOMX|nr:putative GPI-anchored protein PB15E9.01c [Scophthalmus maximus]
MTVTIHLVVLFVLAVLTGSSQTRGQSSVAPPVFITQSAFQSHANTSASPDLTEDPGNEVPKRTRDPASRDETMTITGTKGSVDPENVTNAVFETGLLSMSPAAAATPPHADAAVVASAHTAAAHGLSSTPPPWGTTPLHRISPAESRAPLTGDPPTAVSTQPAHTVQGTSSTARSSTAQPQSESLTIDRPLTSALGPAGPRHREVPSELNIGDEGMVMEHSFRPRLLVLFQF